MIQQKYRLRDIDIIIYPCIKHYFSDFKKVILCAINKDYKNANDIITRTREACRILKYESIHRNDEKTANISFLLDHYQLLLKSILDFWQQCDDLDYQKAWNFLQDGLSAVRTLRSFVTDNQDLLRELDNYLCNIEKLYPYVYFNSIESINKKKVCSICNNSPFSSDCEHVAGDLYMGEMAINTITDATFLGVALVKNPADKRCVVFMDCNKEDIESTPFRLVHSLIKTLEKPFNLFDLELTKRKLPLAFYNNWPLNAPCPCNGEKSFKDCCSDKDFVENPHYDIIVKGVIRIF